MTSLPVLLLDSWVCFAETDYSLAVLDGLSYRHVFL